MELPGRDGSLTNLDTVAVVAEPTTSSKAAMVKVAIPKASVAKQSTIEGRLSHTRSSSTVIRQQPINNIIEFFTLPISAI